MRDCSCLFFERPTTELWNYCNLCNQ